MRYIGIIVYIDSDNDTRVVSICVENSDNEVFSSLVDAKKEVGKHVLNCAHSVRVTEALIISLDLSRVVAELSIPKTAELTWINFK